MDTFGANVLDLEYHFHEQKEGWLEMCSLNPIAHLQCPLFPDFL